MKYIDADKLIAEIERRIEEYNIQSLRGAELSDLLSFIDSLQQEQPEVDLEEETPCKSFHTTLQLSTAKYLFGDVDGFKDGDNVIITIRKEDAK